MHVAAGLDALADDDVGACGRRRDGVGEPADLIQHLAAGGARALDEVGPHVPEEAEGMRFGVEAGRQLLVEQRRIGTEGNQVDAEMPVRALAHSRDLMADELRRTSLTMPSNP